MADELEHPPRGYTTRDVETQREALPRRHGARALVILLVLALALAIFLASGMRG